MSRRQRAIELAGMILFFPFAYGCALVLLVWALALGTLLRDGSWEAVARMTVVAVAFIVGGGIAVDRCIAAGR